MTSPSSKPTHEKVLEVFTQEKPQLRNNCDALALAFHILMKREDFRCIGVGDIEGESANEKDIPNNWNASSDSYSFKYKHPRSSMTFVIKSVVMGNKLLVHGLAEEDKNIHTLEVDVTEQVFPGSLDNFSSLFRDLPGLVQRFQASILYPMVPDLAKEGYQPPSTTSRDTTRQDSQRSQDPSRDPLREDPLRVPPRQPRYPQSPLWEPSHPYPQAVGPPFGYGDRDLHPSGPVPFPGGPMFPGGSGGNLMGPNHPGFAPRQPLGPPGFPRGMHPPPPGARFDPFGPPGANFGEPDNDEFLPPRNRHDDMFG